jgi:hypothetical protein
MTIPELPPLADLLALAAVIRALAELIRALRKR